MKKQIKNYGYIELTFLTVFMIGFFPFSAFISIYFFGYDETVDLVHSIFDDLYPIMVLAGIILTIIGIILFFILTN